MHNEIPLPFYLQQHQITNSQLTNFLQCRRITANDYESIPNGWIIKSSISSNKPLMVFTGTDPEYSLEVYLNVVTANLNQNLNQKSLHQN